MDSPHMGQLVLLLVVLVITILAFYWLFGSQILLAAEKARSSQTERWKTFRVSGIPPDWNKDRLRSFLADLDDTVRPVVESLTADIDGRCSIATVTFQDFPKHFQNGQPWKIPLRRLPGSQSAHDRYLVLDYAFLGITPLYSPHLEHHKVDIIAISGLGSYAFGSFEERDGNHMWLRDSLPYDLTRNNTTDPIARVIIYGYESSVANSNNFQNLEDLAISFHNSLLTLARSPTTRPIIFIAHSLGGLIIKQTLITLSKSKIEDDQKLIKAVYGIVFFGVPHDGIDISSLIPMVEDGPNRFLIESIGHVNSQILSIQQREFYTALGGEGDSEIICFYETEKSQTAQKDKNGNWTMQGPRACLVTKSSATHCRAWERGPEHTCAIACIHSDMVKFGPQDHEYQKARERLIGLARRALVAECGKPSPSRKSPKRHWMVPFERNESFVGREDLLSLLLQRTPPSTKPDACQRTVIEGLGGVGKTQIALETVYRLRDADPSCSILWVPAVDVVTFENAYREIGRLMGVAGLDDDRADVKSLVRVAMNNGDTGRWLLVIDNADDQEVMFGPRGLARYLPCNTKGSILFTTRTREVTERLDVHSAGVIKTAKMSRKEAKKMLRIRLTEDQAGDMASTDTLLDFLDDLPLAIRQASAYMHKTGITVARYLEHCCSSDATSVKLLSRDFEDRGRYETSKNPVAMTWLVSFEHILRDNPRAGEYLQFICLLSERDIPISLLPQATDELEADEAIGILDAYAFVTKREGGESIDMHRLVRLAMRNWLHIEGNSQETYRRVITRLDSVYPFPKHENREIWMRYIAHAQSVLHSDEMCADDGALARLLFNVAESLYRQGHYQEAVQMYRQTVEAMEIALGKEHPSTLGSMNNLGLMLKNMGRYSESEQIYRQALGLMEKIHGKKHPSTLISTNNLGLVLDSMGQYSEAKQIFQQTIPLMEDILGREHPVTLDSKCNMGVVLDHMGQYLEAEEVCRQTLKVIRTVLGKNHPSTLLIMNNLANVLSRMGKHLDAEKMHRRTLQLREKALGKEHPETLNSMDNLASVLNSMGQYSTAEEIHRKTLTLREKVLGEEHPDTLLGRGSLANVLKSMGRYLEAEPVYRKVLKLMEKVLGEKHPSTLSVMDNLGLMLDNIGKYSEADKIHRKTLLLREKALGVEHPERLDSMNNLAVVLGHMGQCVEAETMHRHTLLLREKALGQEHPSTLSSLNNLANVLSSMGKHSEAEKIHRRALQLRVRVRIGLVLTI